MSIFGSGGFNSNYMYRRFLIALQRLGIVGNQEAIDAYNAMRDASMRELHKVMT